MQTLTKLKRAPKDRPWAVILSASRLGIKLVTEDGEVFRTLSISDTITLLDKLRDCSIYCYPLRVDLVRAVGGQCVGNVWKSHTHGMTISSIVVRQTTIYFLRGTRHQPSPNEMFGGVQAFLQWVREQGCGATSFSSITNNLLRRYMPYEVPYPPKLEIARETIFNGRPETPITGRTLRGLTYHDRPRTYPNAMAKTGLVSVYERTNRPDLSKLGFALASVRISKNDGGFYPIPLRSRYGFLVWGYNKQPIKGYYSLEDLHSALEYGGEVIIRSAMQAAEHDPSYFQPWYEAILEGRSLPGYAGQLVKTCTSVAWAMFTMYGARGKCYFDSKGKQIHLELGNMRKLGAPQVSALFDSYVRNKMWKEVFVPGYEPVYFYSDGGFFYEKEVPSLEPKYIASELEIAGQNCYRYRDTSGQWQPVVAGTRDPVKAMRVFEGGSWKRGTITLSPMQNPIPTLKCLEDVEASIATDKDRMQRMRNERHLSHAQG